MSAKIYIKRTAVSGRVPNTSVLDTGELALNMTDGILYGSNGSVIFEIGANLTSLSVNGISYPATDGLENQVLVTDGAGNISFANQAGGSTITVSSYVYEFATNTTTIEGADRDGATLIVPVGSQEDVYLNGLKLAKGDDYTLPNTSAIVLQGDAVPGDILEVVTMVGSGAIKNYEFSITSNTTVIEGQDDSSSLFAYDAGQELLYLNGAKLIAGDDYTQTNSTAITMTSNLIAGDIVDIITFPAGNADLRAPDTYTSSNTSPIVIDTFSLLSTRTAKYIVQANTASEYQASEALVIHDDTDAYVTEYAIIHSGNSAIYSLSAEVADSTVRLIATPTDSGTTFKSKKISIEV